jgi:hypothetical protein
MEFSKHLQTACYLFLQFFLTPLTFWQAIASKARALRSPKLEEPVFQTSDESPVVLKAPFPSQSNVEIEEICCSSFLHVSTEGVGGREWGGPQDVESIEQGDHA